MKRIILLSLVVIIQSCHTRLLHSPRTGAVASHAMVVSAHPLATKVGVKIMQQGGNAVDASIAVQFALAVVYPSAGNIGGGGFMLFRQSSGGVYALDYREKASAHASEKMFLDESGNPIPMLSTRGGLAAGVPGSVDGMWQAHQRFGSLPWAALVQPAIDLAEQGILLTEKEANGLNRIQSDLIKYNAIPPAHLIKDAWAVNDTLVQKDLAKTLVLIRDRGRDGFYTGPTADHLVAQMKSSDGIISLDDLQNYSSTWREPIRHPFNQYEVIGMPPPSSGGVALFQLLNAAEMAPIKEWGPRDVRSIHYMAEAERRTFADRAMHLGDPDFYRVPVNNLVDKKYIQARMANFNKDKASPSSHISAGTFVYESDQTTHLSIVDPFGNAAAVTTTLNDSYGCRVMVHGAGFFLNNEMDDFSTKPGAPNMYGAVGGVANRIEPQKRMLSSMTPTLLLRDNKLFMVVGSPGGTKIITSVYQAVLNVVLHRMTMQEAVAAPRFHHQWYPDEILAEEACFSKKVRRKLEKMGHQIRTTDNYLTIPGSVTHRFR